MPYPTLASLPDHVKKMPKGAQEIYQAAFNSAFEQYKGDEGKATATAMAAVQNKYKQEGDKWIEIEATDYDEEMLVLSPKALQISEAAEITQILPLGEWKGHKKGIFKITSDVIKSMMENFTKGGRDRVVDYEHATLTGQEAPAAGWIKELIDGGTKGLLAKVAWNDKAKEYIKKKEYRFLSPVFSMNRKDKKTGEDTGPYLHSVALTNDPFLDGIMPLVNKSFVNISKIEESINLPNKEDWKMLNKITELLKLKDTATEEEITKALTDLVNAKSPEDAHTLLGIDKDTSIDSVKSTLSLCNDTLKELGLETGADIEKVKEKIAALKEEGGKKIEKEYVPLKDFKALNDQIAEKDKRIEDIEKTLALKEQERLRKWAVDDEKRLTPAMWESWGEDMALKDPEGFEKIANTMQAQINTERISGENSVEKQNDEKREQMIKEEMKLSDCDYAKAMLTVAKDHPELFKDAFE